MITVAFFFLTTWVLFIIGGVGLILWAKWHLPAGTPMWSAPIETRVATGPYRYLRHPMYLGNTLLITGIAGLGGGALVAFACYLLAVTMFGEWAAREEH